MFKNLMEGKRQNPLGMESYEANDFQWYDGEN